MARLTERTVQTAKAGRHSDGDGLHLVVSETGRKKWVLRYQMKASAGTEVLARIPTSASRRPAQGQAQTGR